MSSSYSKAWRALSLHHVHVKRLTCISQISHLNCIANASCQLPSSEPGLLSVIEPCIFFYLIGQHSMDTFNTRHHNLSEVWSKHLLVQVLWGLGFQTAAVGPRTPSLRPPTLPVPRGEVPVLGDFRPRERPRSQRERSISLD